MTEDTIITGVIAATVLVGFVALLVFVVYITIITHDAHTERLLACLEHGGEWVGSVCLRP